jgi:hypothetical protein
MVKNERRMTVMKIVTRLTTAILVLSMMIALLASCAQTEIPSETTPATVATEQPATSFEETPAEETYFAASNIPEDMKFEGNIINILYWDDVPNTEFFVETSNGESVNDAIYNRNAKIEEQFGVILEFSGTPGNYNKQKSFVNTCLNSTMSGADAYDVFCGYSMTGASIMIQGISQNLKNYEILDFEKPWWPQSIMSKATIKDGVYFVSGDISTNFLYMMYLCIFNKEMFETVNQNGAAEIYDAVHNGEWTVDKLIEYSSGMYSEQDGNQAASAGDRYGFTVTEVHFDAFYTGSDLTTVDVSEDGSLVLSDDLFSQKTVNLLEKVCNLLHKSGDAYMEEGIHLFKSGNALFVIERASCLSKYLSKADFSFGILPVPKYDADQEAYQTCLSFPYTMYMISTAAGDAAAAAATIQLMAYESYIGITPALFEESMKTRYADQSDDAIIFDYIREGVVIDLGRLFTKQLDNLSYSIFRGAVKYDTAGGYMSTATKNSKTFTAKLNDINESIKGLN